MKLKITANNRADLNRIIKEEIDLNGYECDLNHIDVSKVGNFFRLFSDHDFADDPYDENEYDDFSQFNGDISGWDVSKITTMEEMFYRSKFNGDISHWNVSNVENMHGMFCDADFNGDISGWNVCKVKDMGYMFCRNFTEPLFEGDLSNWQPYNLKNVNHALDDVKGVMPYWATIWDNEDRKKAIDAYQERKKLKEDLSEELGVNGNVGKRIKV